MAVTDIFMEKDIQISLTSSPKIFSVNDLINGLGKDLKESVLQ